MRGFTLLDLLVVIALVGLFLTFGAPGLRTLQGSVATTVEQYRLLSLLRTARSAATHGHQRTVVCPVDVEHAEPACGEGAGAGWLVFADDNGDSRYSPGDDELLRVERIPKARSLHVHEGGGEVFDRTLIFRPDGSVLTPATVELCAASSPRTARIVISMTGRVRTEREPLPCAV
jgi:Tfp pilus assembly protein FimT